MAEHLRFKRSESKHLSESRNRGETPEDVYEAIRNDPFWDYIRTHGVVLVPGEGAPQPRVMIVGEAPGATENTHVRPFVGASGKVLRSLIVSCAGLSLADDVFITNVVKYRPPGNRTPELGEIIRAVPYLRREWKAIGCPRVIVAVGGTAKNALAPYLPGITICAGQPFPQKGNSYIWPMLHPAYGLRNPDVRPKMERDWSALGDWIREEGF
jgi:uracil-DNA glycosylase